LIVQLSTSLAADLSVQQTINIPEGYSQASFECVVYNDMLLDGKSTVNYRQCTGLCCRKVLNNHL